MAIQLRVQGWAPGWVCGPPRLAVKSEQPCEDHPRRKGGHTHWGQTMPPASGPSSATCQLTKGKQMNPSEPFSSTVRWISNCHSLWTVSPRCSPDFLSKCHHLKRPFLRTLVEIATLPLGPLHVLPWLSFILLIAFINNILYHGFLHFIYLLSPAEF